MDEPKISDYPLTDQGASDFSAATQIYRNQQQNNLKLEKRAQAAKLLAQNDALPSDSGVPGSRDIGYATALTDNMYALIGAGGRVVAPVQGALGALAEGIQQSVPLGVPSEVRHPLVTFLDSSARGARLMRDQARQTSGGIERYLEARRLLQDKLGFNNAAAITTAGEVATNLIGGPLTQAVLAYGERDNPMDVARNIGAAKLARKIPFNTGTLGSVPIPLASINAQRKVSELLADKLFGDIQKNAAGS